MPLDLPGPEVTGVLLPELRKPHAIVATFFERVRNGEATPFSRALMRCVTAMEAEVRHAMPGYRSPLESQPVNKWGKHAQTQLKGSQWAVLEHWCAIGGAFWADFFFSTSASDDRCWCAGMRRCARWSCRGRRRRTRR